MSWKNRYMQFSEASRDYILKQEKGQRILRKNVETLLPEKGSEIFVGNLPNDIYEDDIFLAFKTVGDIYELRVMVDYDQRNRGYCFLQYYSKKMAEIAIKLMDGKVIGDRKITVVKSINNCRLYFGNLPKHMSKVEFEREIRKFNFAFKFIIMYPSVKNPQENRGYCFVEFEDHNYALSVFKLFKKKPYLIHGNIIKVDWAEPLPDPDLSIMKQVKRLYLRNLPRYTDKSKLLSFLIEKDIPAYVITKVYVYADYAFVHFDCRLRAEKAMAILMGSSFNGRDFGVEWARPTNYSKAVQKSQPPANLCMSVPAKSRKQVLKLRTTGGH